MVPPIAHSVPKMTASMHWPRIKREKQSLVMAHAWSTRSRTSSLGMRVARRIAPACTRSLSSSRYSAKIMPSRMDSVTCATSPLVWATMRSAWSVPPMAARAFSPRELHVVSLRIMLFSAPGRFAIACEAMVAPSETPLMIAAPTDLNSLPTNVMSATSASVTVAIAKMTQIGRRLLVTKTLVERGNHRDSRLAAMKLSRYAITAPTASGCNAWHTVEKISHTPSKRTTMSAAAAMAATRIRTYRMLCLFMGSCRLVGRGAVRRCLLFTPV